MLSSTNETVFSLAAAYMPLVMRLIFHDTAAGVDIWAINNATEGRIKPINMILGLFSYLDAYAYCIF